ncbi:hypothetical protein NPX13_g9881 [Xylaria arbuscula]|uniref:Reverse transcriptase n=1 Tax=Xylaria arbuscula TaxID=114810 RepID=A0A9W8N5W1_9PEZI|nr:hypothetical protein NPX13_g9881 [Xylaria arbuscula]
MRVRTLIDTGAEVYLLGNRSITVPLAQRWDLPRKRFDNVATLNGFGKGQSQVVDSAIAANFQIQGRTFRNTPILEAEFGPQKSFDLIIGKLFLAAHNLLPDCRRHRLVFPIQMPYLSNWKTDITTSTHQLLRSRPINPQKQQDMLLRDAKWKAQEIAPQEVLRRPQVFATWVGDYSKSLQKMDDQLLGRGPSTATQKNSSSHTRQQALYHPRICQRAVINALGTDIHVVSGNTFFQRASKYSRNPRHQRHRYKDVFSFSIYELDRVIDYSVNKEDRETQNLLRARLPAEVEDFIDVFSKTESDELPPLREGIDHKIELKPDAKSLRLHPLYNMKADHLVALKQYLTEHLRKDWIVPSAAEYGSPVLFAKKPNGGLRFCVDYRELNAQSKKDRYPLPLISETLDRLTRAKLFTKLDIRAAFNRIRMDPASEDLTTFRTRFGQYKYKVLPFGLCNGPSTFQRYINKALFPYLDEFCTAYVDDILIFSEDPLEHWDHVRKVLQKLREAGLQADIKKSEFAVTSTKFLGYIVSTNGISVDRAKIAAVKDWEEPKTVKELQSFLGFCNFYRQFIDGFSRIAKPLHRLTAALRYTWTREQQEAFNSLKVALCSAPVLLHFCETAVSKLETDASDGVISAALSQRDDQGNWHPVAYLSRTMNAAECNYPIHDKELLAIIYAMREWNHMLSALRKPFDVFTDHQALQYFAAKRQLNARQAAWSEDISGFDFIIRYRPGRENLVADTLSRKAIDLATQKAIKDWSRNQTLLPAARFDGPIAPPTSELLPSPEDHILCAILATLEANDEDPTDPLRGIQLIDAVLAANRSTDTLSLERKKAAYNQQGYTLLDGLLLKEGRLVVPEEGYLRTRLCDEIHRQPSRAHPGRNKMRTMMAERYSWPGMGAFVDRYCAHCPECGRGRNTRLKPAGLLRPLPIPDRPWQHISMDFKTMPKDKLGYDAVLVIVDRLGKRPWSIPTYKTCTAAELASLYFNGPWRIYGTPESITSDRGPQFIAAFLDELAKLTGMDLRRSTAEHPQTDGQTEILNQFLQTKLRPFISHFQDNWSQLLPCIDFAYATQPHSSTGLAPAEVEMGFLPIMTFDWTRRSSLTRKTPATERLSRSEAQEPIRPVGP